MGPQACLAEKYFRDQLKCLYDGLELLGKNWNIQNRSHQLFMEISGRANGQHLTAEYNQK